MTIDTATGQVTWKLLSGVTGTHRVKVMADDGQGGGVARIRAVYPSAAQSSAQVSPQG